jgi:hypothetical protein
MVSVCAWCERFLGVKEPLGNSTVTHGICNACFTRQTWVDAPTLVVHKDREHLLPLLSGLLRGVPEIRLVVDRRRGPTRREELPVPPNADRRRADRRRQDAIVVC